MTTHTEACRVNLEKRFSRLESWAILNTFLALAGIGAKVAAHFVPALEFLK